MRFALLLLSIVLFSACTSNQKPPEPIQTIQAEGLEIPVYDDNALAQLLNQKDDLVHVVNLWATWCAPCVKEIPDFERLNEEFKSKGVQVTLISLDMEDQFESKLVPFVKQNIKSDVFVVLPENDTDFPNKFDKNFNGALPATLIYDKDKRYLINGTTNYNELVEQLRKFGIQES